MTDDQLIREFHEMWDAFPGMARLISARHEILAVNDTALQRGFEPGLTCAKVGKPEMHRGCLLAKAISSGEGCFDMPNGHLIRGWVPIGGTHGVVVHFSLSI